MNKIIKKIKKLFNKNAKIRNNPPENAKQTEPEREEVKKRLKSLGYFDD